MHIKPFNEFIGVVEDHKSTSGLIISDYVGLEKVKIVYVSDAIKNKFSDLKVDTTIYVKTNTQDIVYITDNDKRVYFIHPEDIVAIDLKEGE